MYEFLPDAVARSRSSSRGSRGCSRTRSRVDGCSTQAVHEDDVAEAFRLAIVNDAPGAFNLAGEDVLGARDVASIMRARAVPVPLFGDAAGWSTSRTGSGSRRFPGTGWT